MFTRVQALRFRCLRHIDQSLGGFVTLVGPNASGKTTFLDVIALLGDLMNNNGRVVDTVMDRSADFRKLLWMGEGDSFQIAVEAQLPDAIRERMSAKCRVYSCVRYEVEIGSDPFEGAIGLNHEALFLVHPQDPNGRPLPELFPMDSTPPRSVLESGRRVRKQRSLISNVLGKNANFHADGKPTYEPSLKLLRTISALASVPADLESYIAAPWFCELLQKGIQKLTLNSQMIRMPSPPGKGNQFLPDGSNLPRVINELQKNPVRFGEWLDHVRTALPDIKDITTVERPEDKFRYLVVRYHNGADVPSWLVSDGTLRLLALTIPAYVSGLEGMFLIEEPENGIHPKAIETVVQSLSSMYDSQVVMATHSPVALNMIDPENVLCFAKNSKGATDIVDGSRHPALRDWKRGEPEFGVMFASGILS